VGSQELNAPFRVRSAAWRSFPGRGGEQDASKGSFLHIVPLWSGFTFRMGINKVKLCILFQIQSWYIYEKVLKRVGPKLAGAIPFEDVFPGLLGMQTRPEKGGE